MSRVPLDKHAVIISATGALTPGVGARLYVRNAGTTTAGTGYTSSSGTQTITQPLIAGSDGAFTADSGGLTFGAAWFEADATSIYQYDLYSPDDILNPTQAWPTPTRGADGADGATGATGARGEQGLAGATGPAGNGDLTVNYEAGAFDSIYDVKAFGAVGDGTTDDTVAVQAALDAARSFSVTQAIGNGVVWFPEGIYKISSSLSIVYSVGLKIQGAGHDGYGQFSMGPTIRFTGATGPVLDANRSSGLTIQGIRFEYTHASFSGNVLDLSGPGADAQCWEIKGCSFKGNAGGTASSILYLNRSIIGIVEGCHFGEAQIQIQMGEPTISSYVVGCQVRNCTFNVASDVPIQIAGGAEAIGINNNVFEAKADSSSAAVRFEDDNCWVANIDDNWFGDAAGGPWIELTNAAGWLSGSCKGNRFSGGNTAPALKLTGGSCAMTGVDFSYNRLDNCPLDFSGSNNTGTDEGNIYLGNTAYGAPGDGVVNPEKSGAKIADFNGTLIHPGAVTAGQNPTIGIGMADPQFPVDIKGTTRFLDAILRFGGTPGAADYTQSISWAAAAPTGGAHVTGEIVFYLFPSAGGKIGAVCTAGGTPGTWKSFGAIDA